MNGYSDSLLGAAGLRICYSPHREDVHVIAPGAWLNVVAAPGQRLFMESLAGLGATFTRVDLQLTDERGLASPRDVWDAVERGDRVTRAKRWLLEQSGGSVSGASVYIGSKTSQQRLIVYDKTAESQGEILGIRWELRGYKAAAETLAEQLLETDEWGNVWAGRVAGFVDFREAGAGENSTRRARLAWFEELIAGAEKMRAYPPRQPRTLDDVRRWLDKQVAPSLAMVVEAAGGDIEPLTVLARSGQPRMRDTHRAMLAADHELGA